MGTTRNFLFSAFAYNICGCVSVCVWDGVGCVNACVWGGVCVRDVCACVGVTMLLCIYMLR